jgi:hypothetical protein
MAASYEFDPCTVDGSDVEETTIDNWKPSAVNAHVPKSEWRQKQNDGNYNQQPGIDELKKIKMFLKRKYPDHQIMDSFGIACETLVAIKKGCYDPISGISLDNQSKIYKEFNRIEKRLDKLFEAFKFLADNALADNAFDSHDASVKRMSLKEIIGVPTKQKKQSDEEE